MFNKLDDNLPLAGPKWINWKNLITGILAPILLTALYISWSKVELIYGLPAQVQANAEAIQAMTPKIDQMLVILKGIDEERKTVTGSALVTRNGDNLVESIWLNELSAAIVYKGQQKIAATNLNDWSRRSTELTVKGTISSPEPGVVAEINESAAHSLHAEGSMRLAVKLSPIE